MNKFLKEIILYSISLILVSFLYYIVDNIPYKYHFPVTFMGAIFLLMIIYSVNTILNKKSND